MNNVVELDCVTRLDLPPSRILDRVKKEDPQSVIIIGVDSEGHEFFASSLANGPECLWLLKRAEKALLEIVDD